ncbi:MAG: RDD family protein [Steroidobacteraceae bacterium]
MPAGLLRRLGALLYDTLLLLALFMVATAIMLPLTGGEAITPAAHPALEFIYRAVLLVLFVGFYGLFWTRRGQTLGMASWRLRVEREDGSLLTWPDTLRRLAAATVSLAAAGLGFVWILFDPERRAWHDRWTRTRVVQVPKRARRREA